MTDQSWISQEQEPHAAQDPQPQTSTFGMLLRMIAQFEQFATAWRTQLDLSTNEYLVMLQLLATGPARSAELSRRIGITTASMTAIVASLERRELVRRVPDQNDRRSFLLYASKSALADSASVTCDIARELDTVASALPVTSQQSLESFLRQAGDLMQQRAQRC